MGIYQDSTIQHVVTDTSAKKVSHSDIPVVHQQIPLRPKVSPAVPLKIAPATPYTPKFSKIQSDTAYQLYHNFSNQQIKKPATYVGVSNENNFNGTIGITHRPIVYGAFYYTVFFLLLFALMHLAYLRKHFGKFILQITGSTINSQLSNRLYRDRSALLGSVEIQMNFLSILVIALFSVNVVRILDLVPAELNDFTVFLFCFGAFLLYFLLRFISIKLMGFIMYKHNDFDEYKHTTFIYYKVLGIILLPLTILLVYSPESFKMYPLITGLTVVAISFIMRVLRGFVLIVKKGILLFYAILYLCTIEILPLLIISKFAISFVR